MIMYPYQTEPLVHLLIHCVVLLEKKERTKFFRKKEGRDWRREKKKR